MKIAEREILYFFDDLYLYFGMPFEEGDIVKYPDYDRLFIIRSTYIEEDTASSADDILITGEYVTEEGKIEIVGLRNYYKLEKYKGEIKGLDRKLLVLREAYKKRSYESVQGGELVAAMEIIDFEHKISKNSREYTALKRFGIYCSKYADGGK